MTCFRAAHDMTLSSRAKGGSAGGRRRPGLAREGGGKLVRGAGRTQGASAARPLGPGGMEKAPWTSGEDAVYAVCGFMGCDDGRGRALMLEAA